MYFYVFQCACSYLISYVSNIHEAFQSLYWRLLDLSEPLNLTCDIYSMARDAPKGDLVL